MQTFSTMADLVASYERLHLSALKAKTRPPIECRIRKYFGPLLHLPLESLSVPVVQGWVNDIRTQSRVQGDQCLAILRTMLNRAIEWNMYHGSNVAQLVRKKKAPRRKRYVLTDEMPALVREIEREPMMHQVYFYLLLFVGPRPGEAELMQRKDVKLFEKAGRLSGVWHKPDTKTDEEQYVPLPDFVCQLLKWYLTTLPADQAYLFSVRHGRPICKAKWHFAWKEVRRRAGLLDVQMRDLRRTCATYLLNLQQSKMDLLTLSKGVMNHQNLNTTTIYAQPMMDTILRSMDQNVSDIRCHAHTHKEVPHDEKAVAVLKSFVGGLRDGSINLTDPGPSAHDGHQ